MVGRIGWDARSAVPVLLRLLKDPEALREVRITSGNILRQFLSEDELLTLFGGLSEADVELREVAVTWIGMLGKSGYTEVVPVLRNYLTSESAEIRYVAATFLADTDPRVTDGVPVLLEVRKTHPEEASFALREIGAAAVPALIESLNKPALRLEAMTTLISIGPAARDAIPHLKNLQNDPDKSVRDAAAEALAKIQASQPEQAR